jgi:hypothetical protein
VNASRFLAAEDRPDQLVLSLYGQLAAGDAEHLRRGRGGERGAARRPAAGPYLPPNSVANDAFLETLRLLLVQETAGLARLAFARRRAAGCVPGGESP